MPDPAPLQIFGLETLLRSVFVKNACRRCSEGRPIPMCVRVCTCPTRPAEAFLSSGACDVHFM